MTRHLLPNSTQVPDVILDHWMAELSGAEFKVVLFIARRTYGFGKQRDRISLAQIAVGIRRRDGTVLDRGTGLSRRNVQRALNTLEERGMILRQTNRSESGREYEQNTYSINLDWQPGSDLSGSGGPSGPGPDEDDSTPRRGVETKSPHLGTKKPGGRDILSPGVGTKRAPIQETEQHPEQETAAAGPESRTRSGADADAFSSLVQELVAHGVGHSTARNLARSKPDECRRQLDYLPFARVKTSKGAWLANAIRDGYGPPGGWLKAREKSPTGGAGEPPLAKKPDKNQETALEAQKRERLRVTLASLEKTHPEAFSSFLRYVDSERSKAGQFATVLSPRQRERVLASYDDESMRLTLLERWLRISGNTLPVALATVLLPGSASDSATGSADYL